MKLPDRQVDVAVIGAGPGGLMAALNASERGLSVEVFDKKKEIGVPVRCGEFHPAPEVVPNLLPRAGDCMDVFDVPKFAISNRCEVIKIYSGKGKAWKFNFAGNILDRKILEGWLAKKAEKSGSKINLSSPAKLFLDDGKTLVGGNREDAVVAKLVVAADGFPSESSKVAGLPVDGYVSPNNFAVNVQYHMDHIDVDRNVTEMFFDVDYAPGGYAWIIPKDTGAANVGLGIRAPYMRKNVTIRQLLDSFISDRPDLKERLRDGKRAAFISKILPVDGPLPRTYNGNLMAVGDAACMVMPTNGGGIAPAMITGKLAGVAAADHLLKGRPIAGYEAMWKERLGLELHASTRMRRAADKLMGNNTLMHYFMKFLGTKRIRDVILCRIPWGAGPLIRLME